MIDLFDCMKIVASEYPDIRYPDVSLETDRGFVATGLVLRDEYIRAEMRDIYTEEVLVDFRGDVWKLSPYNEDQLKFCKVSEVTK